MVEYYCLCNECNSTWFSSNEESEIEKCPNCESTDIIIDSKPVYDFDDICFICTEELNEKNRCFICGRFYCTNCEDIDISDENIKICLICSEKNNFNSCEDVLEYINKNNLDI